MVSAINLSGMVAMAVVVILPMGHTRIKVLMVTEVAIMVAISRATMVVMAKVAMATAAIATVATLLTARTIIVEMGHTKR